MSNRPIKKVNIIEPIDPDSLTIEKDDSFEMAYKVELPLDSNPSAEWSQLFRIEWASLSHLRRPIASVGYQVIELITLPEGVNKKIEMIKKSVASTNKNVDEINEQRQAKNAIELVEKDKEDQTIKDMRNKMKE